jgi:hypothetical protein
MAQYRVNEFFCFNFRDSTRGRELLDRSARQLENNSSYRVCERWLNSKGSLGILNVQVDALQGGASRLKASPSQGWPVNRLRKSKKFTWIQTGYITSLPDQWQAKLCLSGSSLSSADSGGIAAFCVACSHHADPEQIFLWSSRPALRPIAMAESEEFIVAGTRPLLVHRLAQGFGSIRLDDSYVMDSLLGWSLGDRTPFQGTFLLPVDGMARFHSGRITHHPHPTPAYSPAKDIPLRRQCKLFVSALQKAVDPLRHLPGFELRLSGGKDSRLLSAALHHENILPSTVVCHGITGEWEAPVAERVADALGWPIKFVVPEYAYLGTEHQSVRHNLSLADGFLSTEPLQSSYPQFGISGDRGPGLAFGHLSLHRAGWASRLAISHSAALHEAKAKLMPLRDCVEHGLADGVEQELDSFFSKLNVSRPAEILYWSNYRYRVCRWITSHYLLHSRWLVPIYPLVDEKVVRLLSSTPLQQLSSESLVFSAIRELAPQLTSIPLFNDRFRFETNGPNHRFAAGYQERQPMARSHTTYVKREIVMPGDIAQNLCDPIRNGRLGPMIKEFSSAAVWSIIENPEEGRIVASGLPQKVIASYLWTCYQASILHTDGLVSV